MYFFREMLVMIILGYEKGDRKRFGQLCPPSANGMETVNYPPLSIKDSQTRCFHVRTQTQKVKMHTPRMSDTDFGSNYDIYIRLPHFYII